MIKIQNSRKRFFSEGRLNFAHNTIKDSPADKRSKNVWLLYAVFSPDIDKQDNMNETSYY